MSEISRLIAEIKDIAGYLSEMAQIEFAQLLYDEMHRQKMSKTQLAARLGVSPQYIHKVLAGGSHCSLKQMARLMFALGKRLRFYSTPLGDSSSDQAEQLARMLEEFAVSVRAEAKNSVD